MMDSYILAGHNRLKAAQRVGVRKLAKELDRVDKQDRLWFMAIEYDLRGKKGGSRYFFARQRRTNKVSARRQKRRKEKRFRRLPKDLQDIIRNGDV